MHTQKAFKFVWYLQLILLWTPVANLSETYLMWSQSMLQVRCLSPSNMIGEEVHTHLRA